MNVIKLTLGFMHTNCYILYGEDKKAAVIDPAFSPDIIKKALCEKGLTLDKILLTHAHFDHIMAVQDLRCDGAKVYIHIHDEEMLYDSDKNCCYEFTGRTLDIQKAEQVLSDGDEIYLGEEKIKVYHTPGHTKGSVCYISDEFIFSGDTLFKDGVGRWDLYGGNYDTLMCSLKRLKDLEKDYTVLPGHGEPTTLNYEKNDNIYMKTLR